MKIIKELLGSRGGLISLISEKTGKISFKRSAAIMVLTTIVIPDVNTNGLTVLNVSLCVGVLATVALPELLKKT